ncbi:hypothetical protein VaNZ11_009917, partial [Volvox africanus]
TALRSPAAAAASDDDEYDIDGKGDIDGGDVAAEGHLVRLSSGATTCTEGPSHGHSPTTAWWMVTARMQPPSRILCREDLNAAAAGPAETGPPSAPATGNERRLVPLSTSAIFASNGDGGPDPSVGRLSSPSH